MGESSYRAPASDGGRPLRGVRGIAVSGSGTGLYAASFTDDLLAVFHVSNTSARLTFSHSISGHQGLGGAYAVRVGPASGTVYVSGWRDQSVAALILPNPESPTDIRFLDYIRNGEREITRYDDRAPPVDGGEVSVGPGGVRRIGGGSPARHAAAFGHGGGRYLAVAHGDVGESGGGYLQVYKLASDESGVWEAVGEPSIRDAAAAKVAVASVPGHTGIIIAVANSDGVFGPGGRGASIYTWVEGLGFQLLQVVQDGSHCTSIITWEDVGLHYLAVTVGGSDALAVVYRWGKRRSGGEGGVEYEELFDVVAHAASDVEVAAIPGDGGRLLIVSHSTGPSGDISQGTVSVHRIDDGAASASLIQTLQAPGCFDVEPFSMVPSPGGRPNLFLAAASRQVKMAQI